MDRWTDGQIDTKESTKKRIKVFCESRDSIMNFKNALMEPNISDANTSYNKFNDILHSLINKHCPIKYKRFNKYKNKKNDWITTGILCSIAFRDILNLKLKLITAYNPRYLVKKQSEFL